MHLSVSMPSSIQLHECNNPAPALQQNNQQDANRSFNPSCYFWCHLSQWESPGESRKSHSKQQKRDLHFLETAITSLLWRWIGWKITEEYKLHKFGVKHYTRIAGWHQALWECPYQSLGTRLIIGSGNPGNSLNGSGGCIIGVGNASPLTVLNIGFYKVLMMMPHPRHLVSIPWQAMMLTFLLQLMLLQPVIKVNRLISSRPIVAQYHRFQS